LTSHKVLCPVEYVVLRS